MARRRGTNRPDQITGTTGDDLIYGLGRDDYLRGSLGHDRIWGGDGEDLIRGNPGNDRLWGEHGLDFIRGGAGNDTIDGGEGDGPPGSDGPGGDFLRGNDGHDLIYGREGDDLLFGDDGRDTLVGGSGRDAMYGGEGWDVFVFHSVADADGDLIHDFVVGEDTLDVSALTGALYSVANDGTRTYVEITSASGDEVATITLVGVHDLPPLA